MKKWKSFSVPNLKIEGTVSPDGKIVASQGYGAGRKTYELNITQKTNPFPSTDDDYIIEAAKKAMVEKL